MAIDQNLLSEVIEKAGYQVEELSEIGPFDSWYAVVKRAGLTKRLLFDGKDGLLIMQSRLLGLLGWRDDVSQSVAHWTNEKILELSSEWLNGK